ncbi:hypothetical protein ACWGH4_00545 [Streptomyces sp. NPDC054847]
MTDQPDVQFGLCAPRLRQLIADALEAADYRPDMRRGDLADAVLPIVQQELKKTLEPVVRDRDEMRQRFHNQAQAGTELVMELHHLEARVRRVADQIAAGAPWTANLEDTAQHVRDTLTPQEQP